MSAPTPTRDAPPPELPRFGWTHTAITKVARGLARSLFSLEVRGLEHLPADEACIICANHASHADTFALATGTGGTSRRLVFLAAQDYFSRVRWRRWLLLRMICLVEFDRRGSVAAAAHNLRAMGACRDDRRIVVLFPEGTRSRDGQIAKFKPGAAMFADKLALRVIPCRIEGTHAALPKGRWWPRARPLRVVFGPALTVPPAPAHETGAERSERYNAFMAEVQNAVVRLVASLP